MNKRNLIVLASNKPQANDTAYEVVERKGIGHPDTLCDALAEKISQAYSQYCLSKYGVVLRHMVDKIALSGGASKVMFGKGEMVKPVRLYLNCRFTRSFQEQAIPYLEIVRKVAYDHLGTILPQLDLDQWLVIVDNTHFSPGPGVVYDSDGTTRNERKFFFEIPEKEFVTFHDNSLRANDSSTALAYYPLSDLEKIVLLIENTLNDPDFKKSHPYVGSDIKIMAVRHRENIKITVCVPFIAQHTANNKFYSEKLRVLKKIILHLVQSQFEKYKVTVSLNTRDNPSKSDYYLTLTGSAIESGDEGVVGRGNRYNGVIAFTRHMSLEACCGKNPVYHIGKIYTAICALIAKEIFELSSLETYVYISSQIGQSLTDPWSVCVEVCAPSITATEQQLIEAVVERHLANTWATTEKIIKGEFILY